MIKLGNFNVVLDACVLYDSYLRDFLLRLAEQELYQPFWSSIICEEVKRNLLKRPNIMEGKINRIISLINEVFPEAMIDSYSKLPKVDEIQINDKDKHVIAAAIKSNAQVIVTNNLKDFPNNILNEYAIDAQSPDTFLVNLFHLSKGKVINSFKDMQKEYTKPPVSTEKLCNIFGNRTPNFIKNIKPYMENRIIKIY